MGEMAEQWGANGEASWGPCQCGWTREAGYPEGHETWCQCQCWDCQATNTQANNPQDDNDGSDWSGYGSDKSDEIWGNEPAARTKLGESGNEFEVASDHLISSTIQEWAEETKNLCGLSDVSSVIELLRGVHWDRNAVSRSFAEPGGLEAVFARVGVSTEQPKPPTGITDDGLAGGDLCPMCYAAPADRAAEGTSFCSLSCGHGACAGCWARHIETQLLSGSLAAIPCIQNNDGCHLVVDSKLVKAVAPPASVESYDKALRSSLIMHSKQLVYCPGPSCRETDAVPQTLVYCRSTGSGDVTCPKCQELFCRVCIKEHGDDAPEAHEPATCTMLQDWKTRVKKLQVDPAERWMLFRAKSCPGPGCGAFTLKCGCMEKVGHVECEGQDYCHNHACNHMSCSQCKHQYCWVCLKAWDRHTSYWECTEKATATDGITARFKVCYQKYLNHLTGLESARKLQIEWLDIAEKNNTAAPKKHFMYKKMQELMHFEQTLKHCFVMLYYLRTSRWVH